MGTVSETADEVFRDYVVDGVASSGASSPKKSEVRSLFGEIDDELAGKTDLTSDQTIDGKKTFSEPPTVPTGVDSTDAVNVAQLNAAAAAGLVPPLAPVACATTANITLSGEQTLDGVLTSASRVLVKDQSTGSQNGIYVSGSGAWTRATDADSAAELGLAKVYVSGGTTNIGTTYQCQEKSADITVGSTALVFIKINDESAEVTRATAAEAALSTKVGGLDGEIEALGEESGYVLAITDPDDKVIVGIKTGSRIVETYVTRAQTADNALQPEILSPYTSYAIFTSNDSDGNTQISSIRVSDGAIFELTSTGNNQNPRLSADGSYVIFRSDTPSEDFYYVPVEGGTIKPAVTSLLRAAMWGDSLTAGAGGATPVSSTLADLLGSTVAVTNYGIGGQTSQQITARQGGTPANFSVTSNQIPASGSVAATPQSTLPLWTGSTQQAISRPGSLVGIPGTLAVDTSGNYTFTRTTAGSITSCPANSPFIPDYGVLEQPSVAILWYGRNNVPSMSQVATDIASSLAYLTPIYKRFLVLGVTPKSDGTEDSGSTNYNAIVAHNTAMATAYGNRFFDVHRYLVDDGLADAGITPTSGDTTAIAADTIPPSLLNADLLHLNSTANGLVAQKLYDLMHDTLHWY